MLLVSLSFSLQYLINSHHQIFLIISSFCLIINRFDLILMLHPRITSSSSSESTFAFDTSSIPTRKSIICLNETNFNQNANDIDESLKKKKKFVHRLIQSLTDITTNEFSSSINPKTSHKTNRPIRIESALITSDYSHLLNHSIIHPSRPLIDINMNRTIDLIKRNDAGDENLLSHFNDKQVQTSIRTDNNQYLTLEQVPVYNRRRIQFTTKQLIFISISVFVFVILLCLVTIFFIF